MTSEEFKILLNPCPRCNAKHEINIYSFTIPKNAKINDDEYTHFEECLRSQKVVLVELNYNNEVIRYG